MTTDFRDVQLPLKYSEGACNIRDASGYLVAEHVGPSHGYLIASAVNAYGAGQPDAVAWQDIATAPKDGTEIQLAGMTPDGPRVTAGHWLIPDPPVIGDCGGVCRCPEYGDPDEPFWASNDGGFCEPWLPTHWAPLLPHPSLAHPPAASARIADIEKIRDDLLKSWEVYGDYYSMRDAVNELVDSIRAALAGGRT